MDRHFLSVYATELRTQCDFALQAAGSVNFALSQIPLVREDHAKRIFFHNEVFRGIHSFLTHASNVSRLFWPPLPMRRHNETNAKYDLRTQTLSRVQRSIALKEAFGIQETSALRNRKLRDHLEHFDERLDDWRETSVRRNIVNDMIGSRNSIAGIEPSDMFRCFDPATSVFVFRGEEFNVQELASEVERVKQLASHIEEQAYRRQPGGA